MDGLEVSEVSVDVSDGKASIPVPEGFAPTPAPKMDGSRGDFAAFMASQSAPAAPAVESQPVPEQPQPETTKAPATAPVTEVPEKFKNPDGTIAEEKVVKSAAHAEQALAKALELERKLRQQQNTNAALQRGAPVPAVPTPPAAVPANIPLTPLEIQVAQDLINESAALGLQLDQRAAIAQARVQVRLMEAKHSAEVSMTESLRVKLEEQDRRRELEMIAKDDPWILSPEGIDALSKIREQFPHINSSVAPWSEAYDKHLALEAKKQRLAGQVPNPTPTARAAQLPATPVQAAPRVVVKAQPEFDTRGKTSEQISAYVASLPKAEQDAFYAKRGIRTGLF